MRSFQVPADVTPEEAAAAIAALRLMLVEESVPTPMTTPDNVWARAGRLEAMGLPARANPRAAWRAHRRV